MSLPVIVLGAGGHAKVLIDTLLESSAIIAGVTDPDPNLIGTRLLGVPVLGGDEVVSKFPQSEICLVNGLGSVGLPIRRRELFQRFKKSGYIFAKVVHPSAIIASDAELGEGTQVMAGAIIQPGSRIGCNVIVNTKTSVDHDCVIGDHVHLAPGVTLSGGVRMRNSVHVGSGVTVIQGIEIGNNSLIGAGSVVINNVPDSAEVSGVPARNIKIVTKK
ncbi:MAG TPA: acetyltransferase [Nitrospirota bacterium]|nr:acetyltransferase [Nitrospirota bacterium]